MTVVLVAHDEGILLHRTLRSLTRAVGLAQAAGHAIETILGLDRPTGPMLEYLARCGDLPDRVIEFDLGDPGLVRNEVVKVAVGRYVAFLDGDDLYAPTFLTKLADRIVGGDRSETPSRTIVSRDERSAPNAAGGGTPEPIYHAAATLLFEGQRMLFTHIGSESPRFDVANFLFHCEWTCQFAAPREVMLAHPFERTGGTPFGFEDWHILGTLLAAGHPVRLVEGVTNFVRRKRTGSRHVAHKQTGTMLRPCPLFRPGQRPLIEASVTDQRPSSTTPTPTPPATATDAGESTWDADAAAPPIGPETSPRWPSPSVRRSTLRLTTTGRVVPFVGSLLDGAARFVAPRTHVPAFVRDDLAAIHDIEPLLTPEDGFLRWLWPYRPPRTVCAARYREAAAALPADVSHLFLVPWLKHGGSDLETLHYIRAAAEAVSPERVAVLATESDDNPWASQLPAGVTFLACCPWRELLAGERTDVLAKLLVQARPAVIHNMNSRTGYQVFLRHGAQLAEQSKLVVSVFCEDVSRTGSTIGFSFDEVPACERHLSAIFADNQRILTRLEREFGFDPDRLHHHPQPVPAWAAARCDGPTAKPLLHPPGDPAHRPAPIPEEASSSPVASEPNRSPVGGRVPTLEPPLKVLWAGRMDRQKRPDTLRKIADRTRDANLTFDVFGRSVVRSDAAPVSFRGLPHLTYHGPFDGFASLAPSRFDVFLLTSQWEGMPNVLLEAMEAGLPVVASAVGGVPELIEHEVTGLLVDDPEDVDGFVAAIARLARDPALRANLATAARERLAERHTWTAFVDRLRQLDGYLPSIPNADRPAWNAPTAEAFGS